MPRSCSLKTTVSQAAFYALIAVIAEQIGRCAPLLVRDSQMRGSFDAWRHRIWTDYARRTLPHLHGPRQHSAESPDTSMSISYFALWVQKPSVSYSAGIPWGTPGWQGLLTARAFLSASERQGLIASTLCSVGEVEASASTPYGSPPTPRLAVFMRGIFHREYNKCTVLVYLGHSMTWSMRIHRLLW